MATAGVSSALTLAADARTWKSADGSKSFEGEFVEFKDGQVTVKRANGRRMTFPEAVLSEGDREWVKAELVRIEKEAERKAEAEKLAGAEIPSALEGKLVKLSGKSFKKYEPATPAKYYLLYFSASW